MDVSITGKDELTGKTTRNRQLLTENWAGTWTVSYSFISSGITLDYTGNIYGPMLLPLLSPTDPRPENHRYGAYRIFNSRKGSPVDLKYIQELKIC